MDESTLRRQAAPKPVMADQLRRLVELAALPNITLRVLPFDAEVDSYLVAANSFTVYESPDPADPVMVAVETETSDLHLGDEEDVNRYKLVYSRLSKAALSPKESIRRLGVLAEQP